MNEALDLTKNEEKFPVKVDPNDPKAPFTNINGGQGADFVSFNVNAPVRIALRSTAAVGRARSAGAICWSCNRARSLR